MGDFFQKIDTTLANFTRGIVSRLERRDSQVDSLIDCTGFNLSESYGALKKDFGSTAYTTVPAGVVDVLFFDILRIESLDTNFMILVGTDSDGMAHWYSRKHYDVEENGGDGIVDAWVELTEFEEVDIESVTGSTQFVLDSPESSVNDHYVGWIAYNLDRGNSGYISDYVGASDTITLDAARFNWGTGDTLRLFRFNDVSILDINGLDAVSVARETWFKSNTVGDRMAVGYQLNAGASEVPMGVSIVRNQFFNSRHSGLLSPTYNKLHFGAETPNHTDLAALGVTARIDAAGSTVYVPTSDLYNTTGPGGKTFASTAGGARYAAINEGATWDPNGHNVYVQFGSHPGTEYTCAFGVGCGSVTLPAKGSVRVYAHLQNTGTNYSSLIVRVGLIAYDPATGQTSAIGEGREFRPLQPNHSEMYFFDVDVNDFGVFTSPVNLGIAFYASDYPNNHQFDETTFRVLNAYLQTISAVEDHQKIRLAFVPQYDGYMLGRPIVQTFEIISNSGSLSYVPRLGIDFARFDKRLTDMYVFTDEGDASKVPGDFMSAWYFRFTAITGNRTGAPFNEVGYWEKHTVFINGTGTLASSGTTVTGTGTIFLSELAQDDVLQVGTFAGTGTVSIDTTTAVVGLGTAFLTELRIGDLIFVASQLRQVVAIASNTALTVNNGFAGVLAGQSFTTFARRTVIAVASDTSLTVDAAFPSALSGNSFSYMKPYADYITEASVAATSGPINAAGSDRPTRIAVGRASDGLTALNNFIGYAVPDPPPSIAARWRHQVQASFGQSAIVVVDESDTVLRRTHYSELIHNDRSFPQVKDDIDGNPIMLFLAAKGEILGIFGQLGNIYVYKPQHITIIDGTTVESHVFPADVVSKHGIVQTPVGLVHAGLNGIYVYPNDGGLQSEISAAIREDYANISATRKSMIMMADCPDMGVMLVTVPESDTPSEFNAAEWTTWIYHYETGAWWKRRFARIPLRYTKLYDSTLIFATTRNGSRTLGTGTVKEGASPTEILGTGTSFLSDFVVGDFIEVAGEFAMIVSIATDTKMNIDQALPVEDFDVGNFSYYINHPRVMEYPVRTTYADDGQDVYWRIETQWLQCGTQLQKTLNTVILSAQDAGTGAAVGFDVAVYFDRSDTAYCTITSDTLGVTGKFSEIVMNALKPNSFREVKLVITSSGDTGASQRRFDISEIRLTGESHSTGKEN